MTFILGGGVRSKVKSGVDGHIREFRGQLTGEVQRMFKEVGKLRDEKQTLQREIADLMAVSCRPSPFLLSRVSVLADSAYPILQFQAKHGAAGGPAKGSVRPSARRVIRAAIELG